MNLSMDFDELKDVFGLIIKSHRIGRHILHIAEVEQVDNMVAEIYPGGVTVHGDAPVWMITWPAALAMAEHLLFCESLKEKQVLELGCGTAAPGIAAALAGAHVVSTDYDPLALALARYNGKHNECPHFKTHILDWYKPDLEGHFEYVIGSEVVYFAESYQPLLNVLSTYLAPGGRIILSDQWRPQMKIFLRECREIGFTVEQYRTVVHLPEKSWPVRITILTRGA